MGQTDEPRFRSILITGASSGIGEALARHYARDGVTLFLSGRDEQRVEAVARACRTDGARASGRVVDVRSRPAMDEWLAEADAEQPLDLVVANAAIAAGQGQATGFADQAREIIDTNMTGVVNTVLPALHAMRKRGRGQIGVVSSLAGYYGLASTPAYSASKAAIKAFGEGLRARYAGDGVGLSVICPGHVRTRMSANNRFPMPLIMDADRAALIIARGLERNRARIAFPLPLAFASWLLSAMPAAVADRLTRKLPRKE